MAGIADEIVSRGEVDCEEENARKVEKEAGQVIEESNNAINKINNGRLEELREILLRQEIDEFRKSLLTDEYKNLQKCVEYHHSTIKYWSDRRDIATTKWKMALRKADGADDASFDKKLAQSPILKHLNNAVASIDGSSLNPWNFGSPRQKTQKDRLPELRQTTATKFHLWRRKGKMCQCQLSWQWGNNKQVTVSHLLGHATKNHLREILEINDINDDRNLLLLSKGIENAYEEGEIYFEYVKDANNDRTFRMIVLHDEVRRNPIFDGAVTTIGDVEGNTLLIHRLVDPPFKRVLSDHAQNAHRNAKKQGWTTTEAPEEYGSPLKGNVLSFTQVSSGSIFDNEEDMALDD